MSVIDNYEKAKQLPLGHYDRANAKKAIEHEYRWSQLLETFWLKKLKKKINRIGYKEFDAISFINEICTQIGSKKPKKVICDYSQMKPGTGGHYEGYTKTIVLSTYPSVKATVHELAHHISHVEKIRINEMPEHLAFLGDEITCSFQHGKSFLWTEDLIFQIAQTIL